MNKPYGDRVLDPVPPTPEYRLVGWHCIYHEQAGRLCHNPLDCDLVPIWALTVEAAKRELAKVPFGSGKTREVKQR